VKLEVIETEAKGEPPPADLPYRVAPSRGPRSRLTIRWRDRRFVLQILVITVAWWVGIPFADLDSMAAGVLAGGGLALVILSVATLVNRRTVHVDATAIAWSSEPLPLGARRRIGVEEVDQLFVDGFPQMRRHVVMVRTRGGARVAIADFPTPEQARWFEQRVEAHLGLADRRVEGELRPPPDAAS
jgi:hypothetical protein